MRLSPAKPVAAPIMNTPSAVSHDRIAKLAYEKWCSRGCPHGSDQQDWQAAEAELRAQVAPAVSAPRR